MQLLESTVGASTAKGLKHHGSVVGKASTVLLKQRQAASIGRSVPAKRLKHQGLG